MSPSTDSVYVLFGATGGIGSCLARNLAQANERPILVGRNEVKLTALADELGSSFRVVDVTDFGATKTCLEEIHAEAGKVDGVVNCIGSVLLKPAHLTSQEDYAATIRANLDSAFSVVRAAVPVMRKHGGSVVLISSAVAQIGLPNHEAIAAAKAGIIGLARSAAATYASQRIRCNVIAPGLVDTAMTKRITSSEAALKASFAMHPLGRIGQPEDIVSAISWLLDPKTDWITGQVIAVDGGLSTLKARGCPSCLFRTGY
jgi:NAD(P)-dependent dehydrogenase (short-subunit alcohol dehydrogenase family)